LSVGGWVARRTWPSPATRADAQLLALALVGGWVDAISYLALGKVFTANMTGNTVLLGVALARGTGGDGARAAVALGGFCLGAGLGVLSIPPREEGWPRRARAALLIELLTLVALLVVWAAAGLASTRYALIAIAGAGMGIQSAAVRASDIRGVNTTYMTSTLLNAIARLLQRARGAPQAQEGPSLPGAAWATYAVGAVGGAFAALSWRAGAVAVPLAIVAVITGGAARRPRQSAHGGALRPGRERV
jgi:uncharacterized membrane protein YoaK (UPF0700 family)